MKRTYLIKLAVVIVGLICVGVCGCKKKEPQKEEVITGEVTIDAIREAMEKIPDSELNDLEQKFLSNPDYQWEFIQKDYKEYLPLLLAVQKRKPQTSVGWCHLISMGSAGLQTRLQRPMADTDRDWHNYRIICLKESLRMALAANESYSDVEEQKISCHALNRLRHALALETLRVGGDANTPRQLAEDMLKDNVDSNSWNYGNIINQANTVLGYIALQEDDIERAKIHLLKSANTKGSPQLNSFGPSFILASELLQRGQKEVVLEYLDLVAAFWANPEIYEKEYRKRSAQEKAEKLAEWKVQIREGKIPNDRKWGIRKKSEVKQQ